MLGHVVMYPLYRVGIVCYSRGLWCTV